MEYIRWFHETVEYNIQKACSRGADYPAGQRLGKGKDLFLRVIEKLR